MPTIAPRRAAASMRITTRVSCCASGNPESSSSRIISMVHLAACAHAGTASQCPHDLTAQGSPSFQVLQNPGSHPGHQIYGHTGDSGILFPSSSLRPPTNRSIGQQFVANNGRDDRTGNQPFVVDATAVILTAVFLATVVAVFIAALEALAEVVVVFILGQVAAVVSVVGILVRER